VAHLLCPHLRIYVEVLQEAAVRLTHHLEVHPGKAAAEARKQAFLNVDVFGRLFQQHKGKLLPADEFLKNIIEQDCKIPREYSEQWVSQFKEGARSALLFHDRGDGRIQISEFPIVPVGPSTAQRESTADGLHQPERAAPIAESVRIVPREPGVWPASAAGHVTKIQMSGGEVAHFSVPGRLTRRDAARLIRAQEGLAVLVDSMVLENEEN